MDMIADQLVIERLTAERDRAQDIACRLEQENAEALRIARASTSAHEDGHPSHYTALMDIQRVLGASDE